MTLVWLGGWLIGFCSESRELGGTALSLIIARGEEEERYTLLYKLPIQTRPCLLILNVGKGRQRGGSGVRIEKKQIRKEDGRILVYYHFPETATETERRVFEEVEAQKQSETGQAQKRGERGV